MALKTFMSPPKNASYGVDGTLIPRSSRRCCCWCVCRHKIQASRVHWQHLDGIAKFDELFILRRPFRPMNCRRVRVTGFRKRDERIHHLVRQLPVISRPFARRPDEIQGVLRSEPVRDIAGVVRADARGVLIGDGHSRNVWVHPGVHEYVDGS